MPTSVSTSQQAGLDVISGVASEIRLPNGTDDLTLSYANISISENVVEGVVLVEIALALLSLHRSKINFFS